MTLKSASKIEEALLLAKGTLEAILKDDEDEEIRGHVASERECEILAAWKRGERTPEEVAEITGYSLDVVGLFLPLGIEKEYL